MPRAALLSIHARMTGTEPASWEDPSLVTVWGPRFSAYGVAKRDLAVYTLGRLPDEEEPLRRAQDVAARLAAALAGTRMTQGAAARAMGAKDATLLRYAAPTGTVLMRWDGSRQPDIWNVPAPDPHVARLELARRYLHLSGPATPEALREPSPAPDYSPGGCPATVALPRRRGATSPAYGGVPAAGLRPLLRSVVGGSRRRPAAPWDSSLALLPAAPRRRPLVVGNA